MSIIEVYSCDRCHKLFEKKDKDSYIHHLQYHVYERKKFKQAKKELADFYANNDFENMSAFDLILKVSSDINLFFKAFSNKRIIEVYETKGIIQTSYIELNPFVPKYVQISNHLFFNGNVASGLVMCSNQFTIPKSFFTKNRKKRKYLKLSDNVHINITRGRSYDSLVGMIFDDVDLKLLAAKLKLKF